MPQPDRCDRCGHDADAHGDEAGFTGCSWIGCQCVGISPRASTVPVHGVTWLVLRDGCVALERCPKKARVLGVGEWFVPGGKIEGDETALDAVDREIAEEWPSVEILELWPLPIVEGSAVPPGPRGVFLMRPFVLTMAGDLPARSSEGIPLRWAPIAEALASPVPQVRMMVAAACASSTLSETPV